MKKRTLLSWSSGKDSAWALHVLNQDPEIEVVGLFTVLNEEYQRVAMHAVRVELLKAQAEAAGLPVEIIYIPGQCSNQQYESAMQAFIDDAKALQIDCMAFGDLFLLDIRAYREKQLKGTGFTPIFPLWEMPTMDLANQMFLAGVAAFITCVDPRKVPTSFAGRRWDQPLLDELPETVDPCGENGEFHTVVVDGPMFSHQINISIGEVVERDGFVFADVIPEK